MIFGPHTGHSLLFANLKLCVIFVLSMKMPVAYKPIRGQTSLEYLLLLAVVAVVVIASFGQGLWFPRCMTRRKAIIILLPVSSWEQTLSLSTAAGVRSLAPSGAGPTVMYRACECPAPAFGGAYCQGSGAVTFRPGVIRLRPMPNRPSLQLLGSMRLSQ